MNVLIGGTGFIGSALAMRLVQQGEQVISIARNAPEKKEEAVEYCIFDISTEPEKLAPILGVGATIFLLVGQNYSGFDKEKETEVFSRILDVVKTSSPRTVIFTSSALVYGECATPANEAQSLYPKDQYSEFKVVCEKIIREKLTNIPVGILRLGNVYGSEKNKGFIGLVFNKALEGSTISVNGDGLQKRDYIFLDEVVSAIISIKEQITEFDIINVATGESETLLNVIETIGRVTGKKVSYIITGVPVEESKVVEVDNTRLKEKYGFAPQIFLKEGLQKTWEHYKKRILN